MKKLIKDRIKIAYEDLIDYADYFHDEILDKSDDKTKKILDPLNKKLEALIEDFRLVKPTFSKK